MKNFRQLSYTVELKISHKKNESQFKMAIDFAYPVGFNNGNAYMIDEIYRYFKLNFTFLISP